MRIHPKSAASTTVISVWTSHRSTIGLHQNNHRNLSKVRNQLRALVLGLLNSSTASQLSDIGNKIDLGEIETLFVNEDNLWAGGLTEKQLGKVQIIYLGSRKNRTSKFADLVLPGVTVFEKHGTFINQQFRIQKCEATIPPPNPLADNRVSLVKILKWLLPENDSSSCEINSLWNERSASVKALKGINSSKLPEFGIMLNQENWEKGNFLKVNRCTILSSILEDNRPYNFLIGF